MVMSEFKYFILGSFKYYTGLGPCNIQAYIIFTSRLFWKTAGGIVLGSVAISAVSAVSADVLPYISVAIKASFLKLGKCNICKNNIAKMLLDIFIDRRGYSSVNIFFFRRYDWHVLQQNLAIAPSSNFLCLFSNSRRSSDRTNKWPLRMTLMYDLDLSVISYFEP